MLLNQFWGTSWLSIRDDIFKKWSPLGDLGVNGYD